MNTRSLASLLDLRGKTALVTGAAQGIGEAIAIRLAEAGSAVVICDINGERAEQTAQSIRDTGAQAIAIRADVARVADTQTAINAAVETFGSIDILVNNAALVAPSPVMEIDEKLWDTVLDIDLKGVFFQAQAAARQMIAAGRGGKIINIASVDAVLPVGGLVPYDSAKGGVAMMTRSLAKELGKHGITVNAVAPGGVATPGAREASPGIMAVLGIAPEAIANLPIRSTLGRYAEPDDIAKVVYFLSTGLADYMTGAFVTVDGGYLLI
ncbi:SDR family oxidoreductase [Paraburkholderia sp. BL10I2N1]|uniref:SDR family NAD(P)-dependent oxidoreductase n=1 Tax=Paraburkholderia sp. BL10I2N1 TaxID=1938796 RepID=UPI00105BE116|nr:SDR family oxidoreductase [Paraburkholderia sp. BL10I2N1]TDN59237.1 glucose 1-dehydrogenase/2-deoxy-D-gluconate 3-dehydrogenase [Paraburkholderia sp. BL10I2N1]